MNLLKPLLWCVILLPFAALSEEAQLNILSPTTGSRITAGSSFTIDIQVQNPDDVDEIVLSVDKAPEFLPSSRSVRHQVSVPTTSSRGPIFLVARARSRSSGRLVSSNEVTVNIDDDQTASAAIEVTPSAVELPFVGAQCDLSVFLRDYKNNRIEIDQAGKLSLTTESSEVVELEGLTLTAVGAGRSQVIVRYGELTKTIPVQVKNIAQGDLDGDGVVDSNDLHSLQSWSGHGATTPKDARDLNGDGRIGVADEQILIGLCTFPNCSAAAKKD